MFYNGEIGGEKIRKMGFQKTAVTLYFEVVLENVYSQKDCTSKVRGGLCKNFFSISSWKVLKFEFKNLKKGMLKFCSNWIRIVWSKRAETRRDGK